MKLDDFFGSLFASGLAILAMIILTLLAPFDLVRVTFGVVFFGMYHGHVAEAYELWGQLYIGAMWTLHDLAIGKMSWDHAEELWNKVWDSLGCK